MSNKQIEDSKKHQWNQGNGGEDLFCRLEHLHDAKRGEGAFGHARPGVDGAAVGRELGGHFPSAAGGGVQPVERAAAGVKEEAAGRGGVGCG